jgi:outer membrane murein-binding lipoprotein Lpp
MLVRRKPKMAKKNHWAFYFLALVIAFTVTGCITNYHIQLFSNDVETLPVKTQVKRLQDGREVVRTEYEGMFYANDYEKAMTMAKEAGFTKVLSVEYGTTLVFGFIGEKWVRVRCSKEVE